MAVGLYVPQLTFNKFRKGEVVRIDEDEYANLIERKWLKPYTEGDVVATQPTVDDDVEDTDTGDVESDAPSTE